MIKLTIGCGVKYWPIPDLIAAPKTFWKALPLISIFFVSIKEYSWSEARSAAEAQMLDQAISEMGEVTDVVVAELKKGLQQHMGAVLTPVAALPGARSFLERAERGASVAAPAESLATPMNVRVGTSEVPYPTIGSLAQDMETRRDAAERLERAKILELILKLLEAENEMIKDALEGAL